MDRSGMEIQRFIPKVTIDKKDTLWDPVMMGDYSLETYPYDRNKIFCVQNLHESLHGRLWGYFLLDLTSKKMKEFTEGSFLSWASDHKRYCTGTCRYLGPYGHHSDGRPRTVLVAALQVGSLQGKLKTISHGTVLVSSGDWRK